ncbi:MAG: sigma-70 family RNA polymerase sigma factor [Deltaproteobacteria bacterium]|nr:sigma-70 family RNA polymerase sigma factor [Deltaproteobacteria bacterium]
MTEIDDNGLISGIKANDPICLKILVDRYAGWLLSFVTSRGLSREDGEEVVNDSLYKIVKNINKFNTNKGVKFSTWVFRITINTALDKLKQEEKSPISQSTDERAENGIQDAVALWQEPPQMSSELGQLSQKILGQALESLSENDQDILRFYASGFQCREIAALLNKTPNAVKVGHHRAKERLKQKYIDILESSEHQSTANALDKFLGIEAINEKESN